TRWTGNLAASHGLGGALDLERLDELFEEERYAALQIVFDDFPRQPSGDLHFAAFDQVDTVGDQEVVQHPKRIHALASEIASGLCPVYGAAQTGAGTSRILAEGGCRTTDRLRT